MVPDFIKNGLLEGAPLSLVKTFDSIKKIWERLNTAYGDTKSLLRKKTNIVDINSSWNLRYL